MSATFCKKGHDKRVTGQRSDGFCKECHRVAANKRRTANLERYREKARKQYATKSGREKQQRYYAANHQRCLETQRKWREANPEIWRAQERKRRAKRYGMTVEQFDAQIDARKNRCDICVLLGDLTAKELCQDHDKITGQNRGMLCDRHNLGLGHFNHSPEDLMAACEYMKTHAQLRLVVAS